MTTSKQASKHTHVYAQCSHGNVGLAQARPNNPKADGIIGTAKVHLHVYPILKGLTVALAIDYYRQEQQMIDM